MYVYYAEEVKHNMIFYGSLDKKGYTLGYNGSQRVLSHKVSGDVAFDIDLICNVLAVSCRVEKTFVAYVSVIMSILDDEASRPSQVSHNVQKGTLVDFHRRFGHLSYDTIERLARDPSCDTF